ncbi:hypothetical protein Hanom_Chr10g00945811 [Helianthus anomalus]
MANKSNLSGCFNILNRNGLAWYVDTYAIPASLHPVLPKKNTLIYLFPPGKIGIYTLSDRLFLLFHEVHLSQMNPFGLAKVCHFELSCRGLGSDPDLDVFRAFYKLNRSGSWYTFEVRNKNSCCYSWITTSIKDWKDRFFWVDDRCIPTEMTWRLKRSRLPPSLPDDFEYNKDLYVTLIKEAGRVQKLPEHILVMGRISTIWAEPEWYPTIKWNGKVMGLKEALRLKSFDSKELDVRATRTPKWDPPYLRRFRWPGGSGSAPVAQVLNISSIQTAVVAGSDRGKKTGSSGTKGSGSKFVIEDEGVHVSIEDEGVHAEEGAESGDDDGEGRPQVSLKRRRATSFESDPNLKLAKKKNYRFSAAGGLLDNLDAHIHGGRTPRDRPVTIPTSPLSFGGLATKVVEDIHMPEPLSFKRIEPSPSGKPTTGVASNVSRPSPRPLDGGDSASSSPLWYNTDAVFLSGS